jgi:hypothetical protein
MHDLSTEPQPRGGHYISGGYPQILLVTILQKGVNEFALVVTTLVFIPHHWIQTLYEEKYDAFNEV